MELLAGCGHNRDKKAYIGENKSWTQLITLDSNPLCSPDVLHDLNVFPYPFADNTFDEIHAYHILEHLSYQGNIVFFFEQFNEIYRILKPEGIFIATVPGPNDIWKFHEPGHSRFFSKETFLFLVNDYYDQSGNTPQSDYRRLLHANYQILVSEYKDNDRTLAIALKAVK